MYDRFNRHINYLRISVTDRCNLRCNYCMPATGVELLKHDEILSFEEIINVVKIAVGLGIDKFRITGGEPLVRKGIVDLIEMISSVEGVKDLSLTTNGIYLNEFAHSLQLAGLNRVNISLDTLNEKKYADITRGGELNKVLEGIDASIDAGLKPIKINCVVFKSSNEEDALAIKEFCKSKNIEVRFIHQMNLETGDFSIVEGGSGGDCSNCNRLRLTANGMIKPCLFDEQEFPVREMGAERALLSALNCKPLEGCMNKKGKFYNIGG